jgi:hypothetical protein
MDAVILAAGLGTRLRPHTDDSQASASGSGPAPARLDFGRPAAFGGPRARRGPLPG